MQALEFVRQDKKNGVYVRSVDIWQGLGYSEHRAVKNIIYANRRDFEEFGVLHEINAKPGIGSKGGRPEKTFLLGEQHFSFLITIVGNSEQAKVFKKKLIKEFWRMRDQLSDISQRDKVRLDGKVYRKRETDTIKAFIELAKAQGASDGINHLYATLSTMENKALFILEQKYPNVRDLLDIGQLNRLCVADQIVEEAYAEAIDTGMYYKDAYKLAKSRIEAYAAIVGRSPLYMLEGGQIVND